MKKILALIMVLILSLSMTAIALAADEDEDEDEDEAPLSEYVSVPLGAFTWVNNDNQKGWRADGADDVKTDLPWAILKASIGIILVVDRNPEGADISLVFQGDGVDDWPWLQETFKTADYYTANADGNGGRFVIPFSAHPSWGAIRGGSTGKFIIGYYGDGSGDITNLGLRGASLYGVPRTLADELGVASTGVVTFIGLAALVLAASGTGAVVVTRKLKKK